MIWWYNQLLSSCMRSLVFKTIFPALLLASLTAAAREPSDIPRLTVMLAADEIESRESAAYDLGAFGNRASGAVPALISTLNDRESRVRVAAVCALSRCVSHPNKDVVEVLVGSLVNEQNEAVRTATLTALVRIAKVDQSVAPALVRAIEVPPAMGRLRFL